MPQVLMGQESRDRNDWCRKREQMHRGGEKRYAASFNAGEKMRCPGWRQVRTSIGTIPRICGAFLGDLFENTRAIVRPADRHLPPIPYHGFVRPCDSCGSRLEVYITDAANFATTPTLNHAR
jgi:hypothetical protein